MLAASARNVHASGRIGADSNATAGGSSWPVGTFPRPAFLAGKRPFREEEWRASSRRPWPRSATSGVPRKWGMTYELAVRPGAEQHNGVGSQGARVSFMTSCATPFTPSNAHGTPDDLRAFAMSMRPPAYPGLPSCVAPCGRGLQQQHGADHDQPCVHVTHESLRVHASIDRSPEQRRRDRRQQRKQVVAGDGGLP